MSIESKVSDGGNSLTINIAGKFDFSKHKTFRESYKSLAQKPNSIVVNLAKTEYIDSAALGMLLLLRDYVGEHSKLRIENCSKDVRNIFTIAKFDRLFDIA